MKIALAGNICNNLYQMAKMLRKYGEHDCHLYLDESGDVQQKPENDDPDIKNNYPDWIHVGKYFTFPYSLFPPFSPLRKELEKYDFLIVSGVAPAFTFGIKKPIAFFHSGHDLTILPFPIEYFWWYKTWRERLWALFLGPWQRMGLLWSSEMWVQSVFEPNRLALKKLGVDLNEQGGNNSNAGVKGYSVSTKEEKTRFTYGL